MVVFETNMKNQLVAQVIKSFMYNVVKWPNIHKNQLKYVWPFYNIMHERVKSFHFISICCTNKLTGFFIRVALAFIGYIFNIYSWQLFI